MKTIVITGANSGVGHTASSFFAEFLPGRFWRSFRQEAFAGDFVKTLPAGFVVCEERTG